MNKYNETIKGTEKSVEGCEWCDNRTVSKYGTYLPPGKYYCPTHANEIEKEGKIKELTNQLT
jgi:hypothetical protein